MDYDLKETSFSNLIPPDTISTVRQELEHKLKKVRIEFSHSMGSGFPLIEKLSFKLIRLPGSFIRPALVLSSAVVGGIADERRSYRVAAALEMAHLAFITHNDVLEADGEKINWGNMLSVLTGDYFLLKAYELLAVEGSAISTLTCEASMKACTGYLMEKQHAFNRAISEEQYLQVTADKTATFYEYACLLGVTAAGETSPNLPAISSFGIHAGLAFALLEELSGYFKGFHPSLHPVNKALSEGIYDLPIIYSLENSTEKDLLQNLLDKPENKEENRQKTS